MIRYYEMMFAIKPLLPDDARKVMHKEMVDLVKDMGGEVLDVDVWGKRYLAYNIKGHNEGYYMVYTFKLPSEKIAEVKRLFGLKPDILRFVIVEQKHPEKIGKSLKKKEINVEE